MANPITAITEWPFLNEPLYRWALFFLAMILIFAAWRAILMRAD